MIRTFFSPAKINLCLHVLSRRPNGYHELEMLMQPLAFGDTLAIELTAAPGIEVVCPGVTMPEGSENIAARAARLMLERSNRSGGVRIVIDKQIPVAAGLGGGSSNAATVLLALNGMLGLNLDQQSLMDAGLTLGADVPFFVGEGLFWARGIGERLEAAPPLPAVWYVLVNPGIAVSTAWAYQNLGLTGFSTPTKLPRFPETVAELAALLHNDLEKVTLERYPEIARLKAELLAAGAAGALMSGSGATVFGLFDSEERAQRAAELLAAKGGRRVIVTAPR